MGRLIDADDFKKFLQALCNAGAPYHEIIQLLDNQPTAYDVEKVVAELEKGLKNLEHNKKLFEDNQAERGVLMCDSEITAFKMAIDIVKRGGISGRN